MKTQAQLMQDAGKRLKNLYGWLQEREYFVEKRDPFGKLQAEITILRQNAINAQIETLRRYERETEGYLELNAGDDYYGDTVTKRKLQLARTENTRIKDMIVGLEGLKDKLENAEV